MTKKISSVVTYAGELTWFVKMPDGNRTGPYISIEEAYLHAREVYPEYEDNLKEISSPR